VGTYSSPLPVEGAGGTGFEETYKAVNTPGGVDNPNVGLSIPDDRCWIAQITGTKYGVTVKGRIRSSPKKEIAARGEPVPSAIRHQEGAGID